MDTPRYDMYLTGKLAEGVSRDTAIRQLAALFRSPPEAMAALLTDKPQLLKRGLDKETAFRYRDALQKAGVLVAFRAQTAGAQPAAARAADPAPTQAPADPAPAARAAAEGGIGLAPAGGELLRPEERSRPPATKVDISGYALAPLGELPATPAPAVAPPDTGHLSLAPAGSEVLTDAERERPPAPAPDTSHISLAEPGTLQPENPTPPPPAPDTSHISLAPADAGPLAGLRPPPPSPPSTAHLSLADT